MKQTTMELSAPGNITGTLEKLPDGRYDAEFYAPDGIEDGQAYETFGEALDAWEKFVASL